MRVLLSVYACEPNKGSEPEIGWQRVLHMTGASDEIWVLTRANNQVVIEADSLSHSREIHFVYCDLPAWARKLKRNKWFLPIYFFLWQIEAYRQAARCHLNTPFDRVYHVTITSIRYGSFMGRLGIPFIIGPIGGGERAPWHLRQGMPMLCKAKEMIRDIGIIFQRYSPLTSMAFGAAKRIYVTTPSSLCLVRSKWRSKAQVQLSVAIDCRTSRQSVRQPPTSPQFLFAGRLLYWKGIHLAIRALAEVRKTVPTASLTLIGSGPEEQWLKDVAKRAGVTDAVNFAGRLPRQQLLNSFQKYTALVFPSLHDSGGLAVLEALSKGLPVVCLDLGGPGIMVNEASGIVIPTAHADETQTITRIANAMIAIGSMPVAEWGRLSIGAVARANELSWDRLTDNIVRQKTQ